MLPLHHSGGQDLLQSGDISGTDFSRGQKYEYGDCPQKMGMSGNLRLEWVEDVQLLIVRLCI